MYDRRDIQHKNSLVRDASAREIEKRRYSSTRGTGYDLELISVAEAETEASLHVIWAYSA